jgi:DNA-binding transcriptional LysR family regulator
MSVDLRHFRHFVALAQELHFGRAAARLGMAQPPLSQSIRRLEEELGFALFARTRRKVELTPAGRVFLDEARRTLTQADEAVRLARRAASDQIAELSITFVSAALYRLLPAALRQFRRMMPSVNITLDERATDAQLADLSSGTIDLGFVHPPVTNAAGLTIETVYRDGLILAVPSDSALSRRSRIPLAELAGFDFVLFPHVQGPALHGSIMEACRRAGFIPRIQQEARQMHTILSLVAAGLGISLVPDGARTMRVEGVRFCRLDGLPEGLAWDLAIAWRPKGASRALRDFVAVVRDTARAMPGR